MPSRRELERQWSKHWGANAASIADFSGDLSMFDALVSFARKTGQAISQGSGIAPGFQSTRASVVNSFVDWSSPFEGRLLLYPYTDAEGLVTTSMGNLIDAMQPGQKMHVNCGHGTSTPCGSPTPTARARSLPWAGDIDADWAALKNQWPRVQSTASASITKARLTKEAAQSLVTQQLKSNDSFLTSHLFGFAKAPADGQLAVHSMAWAMGPNKVTDTFKTFASAIGRGDYKTAASQSHMQGVGIDMRNLANKLLLLNAQAVVDSGANFDRLYYLDGLTQLLREAEHTVAQVERAGQTAIQQQVESIPWWVTALGAIAALLGIQILKKNK